ncbi:uncharacterized protein F4812DRAFT_455639 [Daldinia caldariorum]|uniref:uncharacterized protein n=1 Tax=Daldinia caldariorum TaxID=326644 RepID=UPI002008385D|nr:uncharacterized protein F4812DRAFT_455639 [Daldinia caldariorum]KAI1471526.1 hypothetical protein F4812DRAFT_455639 [Daldinia caldariorum]
MERREIPGYYWDADKKRYFKIEQRKTAPQDAAWSSDTVKKRKIEDAEAAEKTRQIALNKKRIVRSETLGHPLIGGFLQREIGVHRRDHIAASFAYGIVEKGAVEFTWGRQHNTLTHMVVTNRGPKGLCKVYASPDGRVCDSAYTLRDPVSGRIGSKFRSRLNDGQAVHLGPANEAVASPLASIGYSTKLDAVISVPRQFQQRDPILIRSNTDIHNARGNTSSTPLFYDNHLRHIKTLSPWSTNFLSCRDPIEAFSMCVAPPASNDLLCVVGTSHGLVYCNVAGHMGVPFPLGHFNFKDPMGRPPTSDTFGITFQAENPNVLFFGGRPGRLFTGDLRCEYPQWTNVRVRDAIAHVKQVSEHKVLVAGLRSMLSVFDMRYCSGGSASDLLHAKPADTAAPLLRIDGYRNGAYLDLGLDLDRDSGVVAAAHDDGRVALYSARSGRRLPSSSAGGGGGGGVDKINAPGPVRCVQWQTFDGDSTPSLFVGADHRVKVYSFGVRDPDGEE